MTEPTNILSLTRTLVCAYVQSNSVPPNGLPTLIRSVHDAFRLISAERPEPKMPVGSSIQPGYLVCLEDGKQLKTLKRYLRAQFDMSPEEYRAKWNLPSNYPMTAPAYSKRRSELAVAFGLGRASKRNPGARKDTGRSGSARE